MGVNNNFNQIFDSYILKLLLILLHMSIDTHEYDNSRMAAFVATINLYAGNQSIRLKAITKLKLTNVRIK